MIDENIVEIREIRHQISKEFGHNIHDYVAYLQTQDEKYSEQVSSAHRLLIEQDQQESQKRVRNVA